MVEIKGLSLVQEKHLIMLSKSQKYVCLMRSVELAADLSVQWTDLLEIPIKHILWDRSGLFRSPCGEQHALELVTAVQPYTVDVMAQYFRKHQ